MTKDQTLKALFKMLYWANLSDTDQAKPWQRPDMAYGDTGLYGHLSAAIEAIEPGAVEYWANCGEWDQGNFDANKSAPNWPGEYKLSPSDHPEDIPNRIYRNVHNV